MLAVKTAFWLQIAEYLIKKIAVKLLENVGCKNCILATNCGISHILQPRDDRDVHSALLTTRKMEIANTSTKIKIQKYK